jgi:hypothetical protein
MNASVADAVDGYKKKRLNGKNKTIKILAKICLTAETVGGSQFCLQIEL